MMMLQDELYLTGRVALDFDVVTSKNHYNFVLYVDDDATEDIQYVTKRVQEIRSAVDAYIYQIDTRK